MGKKAIDMIKFHQHKHGKTNEEMYADIDTKKDDKVDEAEFKAFFAKCDKAPKEDGKDEQVLSAEDLTRCFTSLDEKKEGSISKDSFVTLIRLFKKVIKDTLLTSDLSIKDGKT